MRRIALFLPLLLGTTLDGTYQVPPLLQDWSDQSLISSNDRWENVPGFVGYRGDNLTSAVGASPDTILTPGEQSGPATLLANQTDPASVATGGVAEFSLPDPVVALQGSGTADAPHIVLHLDCRGRMNFRLSCRIRDIDGSADNAVQPVAVQYRVGATGRYAPVPGGFLPDATQGPSISGGDTILHCQLPSAVDDQPMVQVRWITANAVGSDEWVGIDDITLTADPILCISVAGAPARFALGQNYPNPFNGMTNIGYELAEESDVCMKVFDLTGREIATLKEGREERGEHRLTLDAASWASGIYWLQLTTGSGRWLKKMVLVR